MNTNENFSKVVPSIPDDKAETQATKKHRIVPFGIKDVCENVPPHPAPPPPLPAPPGSSKVAVNAGSFPGSPASLPPITLPPVPVAPLSNGKEPNLVLLSAFQCQPVNWLWPGRVPKGKLTLFVGDPGTGKSTLTMDLVARVSQGSLLPDGNSCDPSHCIVLNCEDGISDTIKPRLLLHGANENKISIFTGVKWSVGFETNFSLSTDIEVLKTAINRTNAGLVIIDPITAYMVGTNQYKEGEVRGVLGPLAQMAEETGVAVVGVAHVNKNTQTQLLYRTQGSVGFVATARSVLAVVPDPRNERRKIVASIKSNLGVKPPDLSFTMAEGGKIVWDAEPVRNFDVAGAFGDQKTKEESSQKARAMDFLREILKDGPLPKTTIDQYTKDNGFSIATVRRAKDDLGVSANFIPATEDRASFWKWSLPNEEKADD